MYFLAEKAGVSYFSKAPKSGECTDRKSVLNNFANGHWRQSDFAENVLLRHIRGGTKEVRVDEKGISRPI